MATIKEVAKAAGVSIATVSNVINNKGSVSDEKYDHVMRVIKKMNYRPSIIAKNLKTKDAKFISVVMPSFENRHATIFRGIQSVLDEAGYIIIPKITEDNAVLEKQIIQETTEMGVSGHLIVPAAQDQELYNELVESKIPVIFMERKIEGFQFSSVIFDNKELTEKVARQCLRQYGRDEVSLIVGDIGNTYEADCVDGLVNAFMGENEDADILDIIKNHVISGEHFHSTAFYSLFDKLAKLNRIPKCFILSDSRTAYTLLEVLNIIKCDSMVYTLDTNEWRETRISQKNLTRIPRDAMRLGIESAKLLLEYIKNAVIFENTTNVVETRYTEPKEERKLPKGKKTLRVLVLDSPTAKALEKISLGFMKDTGYSIEFDTFKYSEIYETIRRQMEKKKAEHDLFMVDIPWIEYFRENGYMLDITEAVAPFRQELMDDYLEKIRRSFFRSSQKIYGFPIMATVQMLFYRKDLFESGEICRSFERENGFELHPPRTWTEFNIVAKFFNREFNSGSPVECGAVVCDANATSLVDELLPRMWAFGGNITDEMGEVSIYSLENIRALKNLKQTYRIMPEEHKGIWWDDANELLLNGKCAMAHSFSSMMPISTVAKDLGDYYNTVGFSSVPGGKPVLGGWMLSINANTEQPDAAVEYLKWTISPRYKIHDACLGWVLPMHSVFEDTPLCLTRPWTKDELKGFSRSNMRGITRNRRREIVDPYLLDHEFAKHIYDAIGGEISSEEALRRMNRTLER